MNSFNINDLDKDLLHLQINKNVDLIFNSPVARQGRTREEITETVSLGIPCEVYLMQFQNCINNPHKYGDVIDSNGISIECKASKKQWVDYTKNAMVKKILPYTPATQVMFWHINGDMYEYQGFINL